MGSENDYDFQDAIKEFKEYVCQTNADVSNKTHEGFLIDYTEFVKLGKKLENNSTLNFRPNLIPKNPIGLKNKINNGDRFVLINKDLYEKICDRNINPYIYIIRYKISKDCIILYGDNNEVLKFKKNDINLIDINKFYSNELKSINSNFYNNLDKIYIDVLNYYKIEMNLQTSLKIKDAKEIKFEGFFVDKIWVDKWKKYSYYDSIKKRYLQNNIFDKNIIIKMIKEEQTKNYLNYDEINDIENYIPKNVNEVYNSIKNLNISYVILNKEFLKQFTIKTNILPIPFYLSFQNISIKPAGGKILYCKTDTNIISLNNNVIDKDISVKNNSMQFNNKSLKMSMKEETHQDKINQDLNNKQIIYIKNLEKKLNDEIMMNKKLQSDIINLKNALNQNNQNKNELISLTNQIQNLQNENNNLRFQLNNLNNNYYINQNNIINNYKEEINSLKYNLKTKENEINNLKLKLLKFEPTINRNDILVINFISTDQAIHCGISCTLEETFAEVEERLYKKFNDFRNTNNSFFCNGKMVLRFKKIIENQINDGDNIILKQPE